jgi:hypothetical protein
MVGETEESLKKKGVAYIVGRPITLKVDSKSQNS